MQRRIQPILARYQKKIATAINSGRTTDVALQGLFDELRAALGPELAGIMTQRSLELTAETGITFDAAVISEEALGWARNYNYQLVTGLTDTTRKLVQQSVSTFVETPGMTRGDLEKLLSPAFGEHRASMIGVTEVTRAYSEATNQHQRLIRDEVGLEMRRIWQTLRDEITCPICGPKHGMPEEDWQAAFPNGPPAHPNCRCSTSLTMDDEATVRAEAIAKQTAREKLLREQVAGEGAKAPDEPWSQNLDRVMWADPEEGEITDLELKPQFAQGWADEHYGEWYQQLTWEQQQAIQQYTSAEYRFMNEYLRTGEVRGGGVARTEAYVAKRIQELENAMGSQVLPYDTITYRRFGEDFDLSQLPTGTVFADDAFVSTALIKDGTGYMGGAMAEIRVPSGTKGIYASFSKLGNPEEFEVLLGRGLNFRVLESGPNPILEIVQ